MPEIQEIAIERRSERRRMIDAKIQGHQDWLSTLQDKTNTGIITQDQMLEIIARSMVARELLAERVNEKAKKDPMTGLLNKGAFSKAYHKFVQDGKPFGLLIIDIDHFKRVNDTHGHLMGDRVLIQTALNITMNVRQLRQEDQNDIVARYGGEEITVLLKNVSNESDLKEIAEKIRTSIGNYQYCIGDKKIPVTVSIGAGIYNGKKEGFFENVDQALYQAKDHGRNRTVISTPQII